MQQMVDPQVITILADMMRQLVVRLRNVDLQFYNEGPKRTAAFVLSITDEQINIVIRLLTSATAVVNSHERRLTGADPTPRLPEGFPSLCGLRVARSGIQEVRAGRPARLFRHDAENLGEGPFDDKRILIKAASAALIQFFIETKIVSKNVAVTWVTNTLNECGFKNPNGQNYSEETIKYWHKSRRKYCAAFDKHYQVWIKGLCFLGMRFELCRQLGRPITAEKQRFAIFSQFAGIASMFAHERV